MRRSRHRRLGPPPASRGDEWFPSADWDQPPPNRLLRLLIAAGSAAAGMCVVVALVTLVITLGAHARKLPLAAASASGRTRQDSGRGTGLTVGRTVATLTGNGGPDRHTVRVQARATWGLAWSFRCPPGRSGTFTVRADGPARTSRVTITASGRHERGMWWDFGDPGLRLLRVRSTCPWHASIVRPGASPTPSSSRSPRPSRSPSPGGKPSHSPQPWHSHSPEPKHSPQPRHSHSPKPKHTHSPGPDR